MSAAMLVTKHDALTALIKADAVFSFFAIYLQVLLADHMISNC